MRGGLREVFIFVLFAVFSKRLRHLLKTGNGVIKTHKYQPHNTHRKLGEVERRDGEVLLWGANSVRRSGGKWKGRCVKRLRELALEMLK